MKLFSYLVLFILSYGNYSFSLTVCSEFSFIHHTVHKLSSHRFSFFLLFSVFFLTQSCIHLLFQYFSCPCLLTGRVASFFCPSLLKVASLYNTISLVLSQSCILLLFLLPFPYSIVASFYNFF